MLNQIDLIFSSSEEYRTGHNVEVGSLRSVVFPRVHNVLGEQIGSVQSERLLHPLRLLKVQRETATLQGEQNENIRHLHPETH